MFNNREIRCKYRIKLVYVLFLFLRAQNSGFNIFCFRQFTSFISSSR